MSRKGCTKHDYKIVYPKPYKLQSCISATHNLQRLENNIKINDTICSVDLIGKMIFILVDDSHRYQYTQVYPVEIRKFSLFQVLQEKSTISDFIRQELETRYPQRFPLPETHAALQHKGRCWRMRKGQSVSSLMREMCWQRSPNRTWQYFFRHSEAWSMLK